MKTQACGEKYNEIARILMSPFAKEKKDENIVISPMSIFILLGILADAVQGKARDEILDVFSSGISYDEFMTMLKNLQSDSSKSGSLISSNAVCINGTISNSISAEYPERLKKVFDGRLFMSSDIIRDVNSWVKERTNNMIKRVADESFNQMMVCLMNTIAFNAEWMEQYENTDVHEGTFHNANGTFTKVQMLESSEDAYIEDEFFTGFIKPYKDKNHAFMALLPKKKNCPPFLLRALKQIDFAKLLHEAILVPANVTVTMPEFKYDFRTDLIDLCKEFGITTLFTPEADFSPTSSEWLKLESIIHKAHIEVDRKGTKVAAVSAVIAVGCTPSKDFAVCLNRPFLYAIMDTESALPVFTGIYNHANVQKSEA